MPKFIGVLSFLFLTLMSYGQQNSTCSDPTVADPFYQCGSFFSPVCACDGITYVNECSARFHGGVFPGNWTGGPCRDFYFFFYPNPVQDILNIRFMFRESGAATLLLTDMFGAVVIQRNLRSTTNATLEQNLDVRFLPTGIYFLVIRSNEHQQTERLVVIRP